MSTDLKALWGAIQRGDAHEIVAHIFYPPSTDTARKSYVISQSQEDAPTAGLGSVETGPIERYWTVKVEMGGRVRYEHVTACDAWKAQLVVFKRHKSAASTQVVREIDRCEFEHLTRGSP